MKTKHTPGPWKVDTDGINPDLTVRRFHPTYLEDENIAEVNWSRYTIEENRANAKLIAAAPDLLGVLIKLEEAVRTEPFDDDLYNEITNVIKKATE